MPVSKGSLPQPDGWEAADHNVSDSHEKGRGRGLVKGSAYGALVSRIDGRLIAR